ncbi:MAG: hypothetical protein RBS80_15875 [Thermoguttaceae bacterium]|jgi:hypothetical protein|nr:hypothetical protein [Thermoguttaceae bacterium]
MVKCVAYGCVVLLSAGVLACATTAEEIPIQVIPIQVSPGTINLGQQGMYVTVHADIPYAGVVTASLTLNGVEVWWTKSDSQGNLVAKFDVESVKAIVEVPSATLELTGIVERPDEGIAYAFSGTDTVPVVDNGGKK